MLYALLISKLFNDQLIHENKFDKSVKAQCIRRIRIPGLRGRIFSADGKILANNLPSYNVVFFLNEMRVPGPRRNTIDNILNNADRIAFAINKKQNLTHLDIIKHINMEPALPITIFSGLNLKELAVIEEMEPAIDGMEIVTKPERFYPDPLSFSNILGYVREQDPGQAKDRRDYSYYIPDLIGKSGLEKTLNTRINVGPGFSGLKGTAGERLVEVDVKGYEHDDLGVSKPAQSGNSVELTINSRLQKIAQKAMEGKTGAVVIEDADTGAVLALVSSPEYNIADFEHGVSTSEWKKILKNPGHPLFNRSLQGTYMPGSIIKPITGIAAIKAGFDPYSTIYCGPYVKIGNARIKSWDWRYGARGELDMAEALKISNNPYFVQVGLKIGLKNLQKMYKLSGLGQKTGIQLPESSGVVPSPARKKRNSGKRWTAFDTALVSFGQGQLLITPLQAADYIAAIANGGTLYKPYLVNKVYTAAGKLLYKNIPHIRSSFGVTKEQLAPIWKGMYEDVNQAGGTARQAENKYITLYGKTGTAQVWIDHKMAHNTWFAAFGRHKGHTYALTILVEGGKHGGGGTCGPIAKQIFSEWLAPQNNKKT